MGDFDPAAFVERVVWGEDDGLSGAESFEDQAMAVLRIAAELDASLFSGEFRGNDPDLGIGDEGFFRDVEGQSA